MTNPMASASLRVAQIDAMRIGVSTIVTASGHETVANSLRRWRTWGYPDCQICLCSSMLDGR